MDSAKLKELLNHLKEGRISVSDVENALKTLPYEDLGFASVDHHRQLRKGFPEVILCGAKTVEQIIAITQSIADRGHTALVTRVSTVIGDALAAHFPDGDFDRQSMTFAYPWPPVLAPEHGPVAVITAGTSDIPVAAEAIRTLQCMGIETIAMYDIGVAGMHRVLDKVEILRSVKAAVVVAGMEGALPSVVAGLIAAPIVAVPTSIGYGASFGGVAALLSMLNSCAPGVAVVNIDNGFGGGYMAGMIAKGLEN